MDRIAFENFRCFRERQEVRLAPLTLLVGENGTGKTSCMALIHALGRFLSDPSEEFEFNGGPFDIGFFPEMAHDSGGRGSGADSFSIDAGGEEKRKRKGWRIEVAFGRNGNRPTIGKLLIEAGSARLEWESNGKAVEAHFTTPKGRWKLELAQAAREVAGTRYADWIACIRTESCIPQNASSTISAKEFNRLNSLAGIHHGGVIEPPVAVGPVRFPAQLARDSDHLESEREGGFPSAIPLDRSILDPARWRRFKGNLEQFGRSSGMFDEIRVRQFGDGADDPFQIQARSHGGSLKGPWWNLADAGNGTSQILPLFVALSGDALPDMLLLQQPEAGLHPCAQAALGSVLCKVAGNGTQVIVETHSDFLTDRVRTDVRDRRTSLKPGDVSLLVFERRDLGVRAFSLELDGRGNINNAPPGYRKFFMDELNRTLGI